MTQETIEKPAEKSMAKLVEILRGRGMWLLNTREVGFYEDDPMRSEIMFECEKHLDIHELADIAMANVSDELIGIRCLWSYRDGKQSDLPCWVLIFNEAGY